MIFSKDGFAGFGTTNLVSPTEDFTPKSASEWLVTINDSMATLTGSNIGRADGRIRFTTFDEFAYCDRPARTTTWSDYECGEAAMKVDRNDLHEALHDEQYGDECCEAEYCSEYSAVQERMDRITASLEDMNETIRTLREDLNTERNMRYMAEYTSRNLEAKVTGLEARLNSVDHEGQITRSHATGLQQRVFAISSRVTTLEQLDSLATPTKQPSFATGTIVISRPQVTFEDSMPKEEIVSGGGASYWEPPMYSALARQQAQGINFDSGTGNYYITVGGFKS
jgi:hypothetical protein